MSFILDALKKSEAERQRRNAPGVAGIPDGTGKQGTPRWMWVLAALLAVNLVVLLGVLLRPDATLPDESAARENAISPEPEASFSELVREAKRSQTGAVATEPGPPKPPDSQGASVAEEQPAAPPQPVLTESYTTFNEMRASGELSLPDLHLDIHVYSEKPSDRFVFVNMSKYTENTTLAEGPLVRQITPEGVVLEYLGKDFLLPRE